LLHHSATITATYGGSTTYSASSGSLTEQVLSAYPTTTTVAATPNPVLASENVTLKATVSSAYGTPSGNVTFSYVEVESGSVSTTLGTVALSAGTASLTLAASSLPTATIKVTASYGGLPNTYATSSGSVNEQVFVTFPTKTTVTAYPNPATIAQNVTLAASVTSSDGTPTGNVAFYYQSSSGGKTVSIGSATISSGVASLTVPASSLPLGKDTITAKYGGSASFSASSGTTTETVN